MRGAGHDRESHAAAIVVALLLSIGLHVCFLAFFKDYSLTGAVRTRLAGMFEGRPAPMNVRRINTAERLSLDKLLGSGDRRLSTAEMSAEVDKLSRDVPAETVAPPPVRRAEVKMPAREVVSGKVRPEDITPWEPRQQIAQITERLIDDSAAALPRREIANVERIPDAPDVVSSVDLASLSALTAPKAIAGNTVDEPLRPLAPPALDLPRPVAGIAPGASAAGLSDGASDVRAQVRGVLTDDEKSRHLREIEEQRKKSDASEVVSEKPAGDRRKMRGEIEERKDEAEYASLDDTLAVDLETWTPAKEPGRMYFKLSLQPRADRPVEVIAKDIVFMMDVSGSLGEERMRRCRDSLVRALGLLNAGDRFNVVAFRDSYMMCFPDLAEATAANIAAAGKFVSAMRSYGSTDLFASLRTLFRFPRNPSRPLMVFMVTDGIPTKGEVQSTRIIGEFSKLNAGVLSVYMLGVTKKANAYLIDMLTACNRGESVIIKGTMAGIPDAFADAYDGIRNPVLADVSFSFDSASGAETYPKDTANLYRDRPLTVYGSCPASARELVFQVRGLAGEKAYDSIVRMDLTKARRGGERLRDSWARAKMYWLVSEFARQPRRDTMRKMTEVHERYGVMIPYEKELR